MILDEKKEYYVNNNYMNDQIIIDKILANITKTKINYIFNLQLEY